MLWRFAGRHGNRFQAGVVDLRVGKVNTYQVFETGQLPQARDR